MIDIGWWLLLIIATEALTEILVAAKITDGIRALIFRLATPIIPDNHPVDAPLPPTKIWWRFLNDVLKCGYCTSVWVAMFFAMFAPTIFDNILISWLVNFIAIHRLSNWFHVAYSLVAKGRIKTYDLEVKVIHYGSTGQGFGQERQSAGPE